MSLVYKAVRNSMLIYYMTRYDVAFRV